MRAGMRLMEAEFPEEEDTCTVRAMLRRPFARAADGACLEELKKLPHVSSVAYAPDSPDYNQDDWALYVLTTEYGYDTPEEAELERTLREELGATVANDDTSAPADSPHGVRRVLRRHTADPVAGLRQLF